MFWALQEAEGELPGAISVNDLADTFNEASSEFKVCIL